jgi:hypothetical protein
MCNGVSMAAATANENILPQFYEPREKLSER